MLKVIDIVYHHHQEYDQPAQVLKKHAPATAFSDFIDGRIDIEFVKHLNYEGSLRMKGKIFTFFKGRNAFWHIPFTTHRYVKSRRPDVVIVEGFVFPLQLIFLRFSLPKECRILIQHHGEKPWKGIKGMFQRIAARHTDGFIFTSVRNAAAWTDRGIINDPRKCYEVLEASTGFTRQQLKDRPKLLPAGACHYLWVGRLNANKDPATVLKAFEQFAANHDDVALHMIYQDDSLLEKVREIISQSASLEKAVRLVGEVAHEELAGWYSAADFYISASHSEGSGYALLEAMACGCIPVVTCIPSFTRITGGDGYEFLYDPGDTEALAALLERTRQTDVACFRSKIQKRFREDLSFKKIAGDLCRVLAQL